MAKAKDELIDDRVSTTLCKKAALALTKHALRVAEEKAEKELIPGKEENIWLVLAVKKSQPEKKLKPFKIPLAHPAVDPRTTPVCLITKDPQREYKDLLATHHVKFISRVVGVKKLKGKFKPFEARRMLLKENGFFLADERVVPLLPGLLGKIFFDAKKQPIPVCLTRKDLKGELERAISSTYMHQNQGTCTSIKIGLATQSAAEIVDNIKSALPAIVKRIHGGWENVQSFNIKTSSSVSLPIWSCELGVGEGARWSESVKSADAEEGTKEEDSAEESEDTEEPLTSKAKAKKKTSKSPDVPEESKGAKGKKRAVEDDDIIPVKKAKKVGKDDEEPSEGKTKRKTKRSPLSELNEPELSGPTSEKGRKAGKRKEKQEQEDADVEVEVEKEASTPGKPKQSQLIASTKKSKSTSKIPPSLGSPPAKASKTQAAKDGAKSSQPLQKDISHEELQRKRSVTGVEKKKANALKSRSGKTSAKEGILGKGAKVRF